MKKILLVDDEPGLLAVMQRSLQKHFTVQTACGPLPGLEAFKNWQDYSVVVSDMRMPDMTGIEFLAKIKEIAPDVIRIMLTANIDQATAILAVNKGSIFRFLNKPCCPEDLIETLRAGVRQHQLITAEHDLLENTVKGSLKILTEIMGMSDPIAFSRAERARSYMRELARLLKIDQVWELEIAALLSRIGSATVPPEVLTKSVNGQPLSEREQKLMREIPLISGRLLSEISRFEGISRILVNQTKHYDGAEEPDGALKGDAIPIGARMLKFLSDLVELEAGGKPRVTAMSVLRGRTGWYDPQIMEAFFAANIQSDQTLLASQAPAPVSFAALRVGNVLAADIHTKDGTFIVSAGTRVSPALMERLRNFKALAGITEPIMVKV